MRQVLSEPRTLKAVRNLLSDPRTLKAVRTFVV